MAPRLCTICSHVPHWLASLPWPSTRSESESEYQYNDPVITLGSWRWMQAQAALAEAEGAGEGAVEEEVAGAKRRTDYQTNWMKQINKTTNGRNGEERREGFERIERLERVIQERVEPVAKREQQPKGCDLCLMIVNATSSESVCKWSSRPYYLPPVMDPRTDERVADVPLVFGRKGRWERERGLDVDVDGNGGRWEYTISCLNNEDLFRGTLVKVPGSWCPRFTSPMGYNDQDPENNVLLLKDWLDNCRRNHTKYCETKKTMATGTDFLPTRLIDVQAYGTGELSYLGNNVRLVSLGPTMGPESDMNKFPPPYLTLSHCWGPPEKRPTTTTKANLAQRMERIPFFELPRTFQDAIEITRKLGHRYLWIDSLCIVQDDEQDWAREAGLMAKVYSHSSCTLSALSSKDSSEGLHLEPLNEHRSYMDLMIPSHASPAGGSGARKSDMDDPFFFRFRMFYSLDYWDTLYNGKIQVGLCDDISPLRSRAWTLQERELSRRIIHFAKNQVLWECAELKATAQRPWHHSAYPGLDPEQEWEEWAGIKKSLESLSLLQDRDGNPVHVAASVVTASSLLSAYKSEHEWWEMVFDYSQRLLTKDTDKLTALSGMAQFYQRNHFPHARYVAGLWSSRLEEELFWEVDDKLGARRPAGYVAPSWSWASVNGRVSFRPRDPVWRFQSMRKKILAEAEKNPANPADAKNKDRDRERDPRKVICEEWKVEEVNLLPKYDDPFGALKGASLIIGGARLVEVELFTETLIEPDPEYIAGFHRHYGGLRIDGRWVADHRLDVEGESEQSGCRLWCLGMVAQKDYRERPTIGGLLLREEKLDVDGDLCIYSRVGKFHNMAVAFFDGVKPRRIKLI